MFKLTDASFPVKTLPESPAARRKVGLFEQRQDGKIIQRIRVRLGQISPTQWRAIATMAAKYGSDEPLHITTRQNIEIHGINEADTPAIQQALNNANLTGVAACGDSLRNVIVCADNGLTTATTDVTPIVNAIETSLSSLPWIGSLPRKFKVGVCGCGQSCTRPWIQDVALTANNDGTFQAIVAGSLGAKPEMGIIFNQVLPAAKIIPLVVAAVSMFNDLGDRENRTKARFRHVRQRLGNDPFIAELNQRLTAELDSGQWPIPKTPSVNTTAPHHTRLSLPAGNIDTTSALLLADTLDSNNAQLRIGLDQSLHVFSDDPITWPETLSTLVNGPRLISCPSTRWCKRGIADAPSLATTLWNQLNQTPTNLRINISGCPNNCGLPSIGDIGLVGKKRTINGQPTECFAILTGGNDAITNHLAKQLHPGLPANQIPAAIQWLQTQHTQNAIPNESFQAYITRNHQSLTQNLPTP